MLAGFIRFIAVCSVCVVCVDPVTADTPLAPGYGELSYPLPAIGSYQLPPLGEAADGEVLDIQGRTRRLYDLFGDNYVLLAFIYSTCSDINGCPLTAHVFYQIKAQMSHDPLLEKNLNLISLSFDPNVDTPKVMTLYANNFRYAGKQGEWQFITTSGHKTLDPILEAYHQQVLPEVDSKGEKTGGLSHILRVFLIDPEKCIRSIYSASFLHQDLIINDVKTLMAEERAKPQGGAETMVQPPYAQLSVPGDDKTDYESKNYVTRSKAVELRRGKPTDLLAVVRKPPLGLPKIPIPDDNTITEAKVQLGRKLFFDRRLSLNDTFSCAMCHIPEQGFTSNELAMAVGIEGRSVRRNSPTIYNVAYSKVLFHDGREDKLEQQIWGPILAKNEMGNPSVGRLLNKIRAIKEYDGLFESAFNRKGLSMETLGMALASYERTLVSGDSGFDRWHFGGDEEAISASAKRGYDLFTGKAGCSNCHTIDQDYALFTDQRLHNTGLGYRVSMGVTPKAEKVIIAPGVTIDLAQSIIDQVAEPLPPDVGLYEVTQDPRDRWKYKTPSLRNVALTAPYMHNGSLGSLREVVDFYNTGGVPNELLDPLVKPLHLSEQEKQDLVSFLNSLTGSNVDTLVADAFAAPIGDLKADDPNWVHGTDMEIR